MGSASFSREGEEVCSFTYLVLKRKLVPFLPKRTKKVTNSITVINNLRLNNFWKHPVHIGSKCRRIVGAGERETSWGEPLCLQSFSRLKPGTLAHICNASTWEEDQSL